MRKQRASFWRGGTSNGVIIAGPTLPEWQTIKERFPDSSKLDLRECANILEPLYRAIMGSPDPYGRQLNGLGGGLSSLSKAVIVDRSTAEGCDLDYLFVQIGIKDGKLDLAGNCGNMSSAVGPFGLDEGWIGKDPAETCEEGQIVPVTARLRNLNTNRIIDADFFATKGVGSASGLVFESNGDYVMDGVPGYASPITLSFVSPGGAKTGKALPTGNTTDKLHYGTNESICASLLDISNPGVFIDGRDVGWNPNSTPEHLNADVNLMAKLEAIRKEGAQMMGMDPQTPSVPKIVLVFPPTSDEVDITCQALSMEQAHKAVPMTLGLNLGVACKLAGTIPFDLARPRAGATSVIGHPSGRVEVGADIGDDAEIISAKVIRTARLLMEGFVNATPNAEIKLSAT